MQPSFPPRIKLFLLSLIGLFTLAPTSHAQLDQADKNLYWVYLNDKGDDSQQRISNRTVSLSPRALENRRIHSISLDQADLPVSTKYLQQLSQLDGLSIRQTSRWLNQSGLCAIHRNPHALEGRKRRNRAATSISIILQKLQ
jgi:hypothetical protein